MEVFVEGAGENCTFLLMYFFNWFCVCICVYLLERRGRDDGGSRLGTGIHGWAWAGSSTKELQEVQEVIPENPGKKRSKR
jgi:hypothetical protein